MTSKEVIRRAEIALAGPTLLKRHYPFTQTQSMEANVAKRVMIYYAGSMHCLDPVRREDWLNAITRNYANDVKGLIWC